MAMRGTDCFGKRQFRAAIDCFSRAISIGPRTPRLYTNRAAAYLSLDLSAQLYSEAITDCDSAIALDPAWIRSYERKCSALKDQGEYPRALAVACEGLCLEPDHARLRELQLELKVHSPDMSADNRVVVYPAAAHEIDAARSVGFAEYVRKCQWEEDEQDEHSGSEDEMHKDEANHHEWCKLCEPCSVVCHKRCYCSFYDSSQVKHAMLSQDWQYWVYDRKYGRGEEERMMNVFMTPTNVPI